jgi:hypothetical protein
MSKLYCISLKTVLKKENNSTGQNKLFWLSDDLDVI